MPAPLEPARLAFAADGTPFSDAYGDVYHSVAGGLEQARHVFLAGNGLPGRWQGRRRCTILETGFGFGLSFLATWQAWAADPGRCERLHFVSIEKHPFQAGDLAQLLARHAELAPLAGQLVAQWPLLVPGLHRLAFERGRVVLTLALGDIAEVLPDLELSADAIYLDGFSPARNPQMWEAALLRHLGRLAAPGGTAATWSVAAPVRDALQGAGFSVDKQKGFDTKREMLVARLARDKAPAATPVDRRALVIGAGMAGASVSERLSERGWQVQLIERHPGPAAEASGNPAGAFHPVVSPDDSLFARFTRVAFTHLLAHWPALAGLAWDRCGVLQLARDEEERRSQARALEILDYPPEYASFDPVRGGVWFPQAGWVRPPSLVNALLEHCGERVTRHFRREVRSLVREGGEWAARDDEGSVIAHAPVVILANAAEAVRLSAQPEARLRRVRGQLTLVPAIAGLDHVVLRGGLALPGVDGVSVVGASFDLDDEDPEVRTDSHQGNLERLEQMRPGASAGLDPEQLRGRVGFRAVVRDRLPLIGALEDARGPGLFGAFAYGSRGLLWSGVAGEIIASQLEGEPLPVERKLLAAVEPSRFGKRAARRGRSASLRGLAKK